MPLRRCQHLFVELDQEPRFAFDTLLAGGDGMDRSPRWLAYAAHLDEPVPVALDQLALLQAVPRDWTDEASLCDRHGEAAVHSLLALGLLISDADEHAGWRDRDDATRDIAWWPPALMAQAHGGWRDLDIQARGEQGLMLSSQQMVDAFGAAPEPDYRRAPEATPVALQLADRSDFDELLARRRTCRNFDAGATLAQADFSAMLRRVWGALGTRTLAPGAVAVKKTSPAGGGLHAVEAYVLVRRVEGMAPGLYHYLSMRHALEPLQALSTGDAAALAHRFVAGQDWFEDVPVMVVMTARFDRLFWKYRRHAKAWRVVHLDVGHLSQTMYLSATERGLGCFVTAAINDRAVDDALGLRPLREAAIALVGFGPRAAEMRTMELDQFDPVELPATN
ncbi:MAG TPA: putative peptide maturation dehydrogenase [Arenimonas sp.]